MTHDHHAADRGRAARKPDEIREHINADHPCCIGVGDAVALTHEIERLRAKVQRLESRGIEDMRHSIEAALAVFDPRTRDPHAEWWQIAQSMAKALKGEEGC